MVKRRGKAAIVSIRVDRYDAKKYSLFAGPAAEAGPTGQAPCAFMPGQAAAIDSEAAAPVDAALSRGRQNRNTRPAKVSTSTATS